MSKLILSLLWGFEARTVGGAALSFPTKKTKALLAYLAARPGKSHSRSDLANLLLGGSEEEQARSSLRSGSGMRYCATEFVAGQVEPAIGVRHAVLRY